MDDEAEIGNFRVEQKKRISYKRVEIGKAWLKGRKRHQKTEKKNEKKKNRETLRKG